MRVTGRLDVSKRQFLLFSTTHMQKYTHTGTYTHTDTDTENGAIISLSPSFVPKATALGTVVINGASSGMPRFCVSASFSYLIGLFTTRDSLGSNADEGLAH